MGEFHTTAQQLKLYPKKCQYLIMSSDNLMNSSSSCWLQRETTHYREERLAKCLRYDYFYLNETKVPFIESSWPLVQLCITIPCTYCSLVFCRSWMGLPIACLINEYTIPFIQMLFNWPFCGTKDNREHRI